tara:strand:- start:1238 stop:2908 length:1671 start_codon:yes stop_codon:yes gene_type:complete
MATNNSDFKIKKGLIVSEGITLGGHTFDDIDIGTEFVDTDDHIMSSGAIKEKIEDYGYTTATGDMTLAGTQTVTGAKTFTATLAVTGNNQLQISDGGASAPKLNFADDTDTGIYRPASGQIGFTSNGTAQIILKDGVLEPVTDNDVDLGSSSLEFKDGYFDGTLHCDVLDLAGTEYTSIGGASVLNELTDVMMDATNFTDSLLIQTDSDGSAPTTGTLSSASDNIGIGKDVFASLTSADRNIAIGNLALDAASSGSDHIAIGYEALSATNNHGSIAIGSYAGRSMSNTKGYSVIIGSYGSSNSLDTEKTVAIGQHAASTCTGDYNVVIGASAGLNLTGGAGNVLLGQDAGYNNYNGNRNVAIGQDAYHNGWASDNIAIGKDALGGTVNGGEQNLAIGNYSGEAITSGDNNIVIGYDAGDSITTGSDNLVIGGAAVPDATADSQLVISDGDGGVTWLSGDANGLVANKISVVAVTGSTTLTDAQSGSYVYCTSSGAPTLPATAEVGQQYTIINNTGSDLTPGLGTSNSTVPSSHTAISDDKARTYVAVAANTWFFVG